MMGEIQQSSGSLQIDVYNQIDIAFLTAIMPLRHTVTMDLDHSM